MKSTNPPLQFIFVGFEPNQQGHAASQEHASSSCPDIFQGVGLALALSSASAGRAIRRAPRRKRKRVRIGDLLNVGCLGILDQKARSLPPDHSTHRAMKMFVSWLSGSARLL